MSSNTLDESREATSLNNPAESEVTKTWMQSIIDVFLKNKKVAIKLISNALSTTAQAFNTTANSEQFTQTFARSDVATATTTTQSVFRNVPGGALLAAGQLVAGTLGEIEKNGVTEEQQKLLRDTMIAAYTLTSIYTVITMSCYAGCYFVFPYIYAKETAEDASQYLLVSGISTWPTLALGMLAPVVFAYGHWLASMMSQLCSRGMSIAASYLLTDKTPLGMLGIGAGNAIGPIATYIPFEIWMRCHPKLQDLRMCRIGETEVDLSYWQMFKNANRQHLGPQAKLSLKIGSQRAAEWVNLWVIALLIGNMGDQNLTATNPATQLLAVLNLFSQGIGIATNLLLKTLVSSLHRHDLSLEEKERNFQKIKSIAKISLIGAGIAYLLTAITIYFTRENIVNFFLRDEERELYGELAALLLWINALSLPFDALRLISSGSLNAFDQMVKQNLWSLFWMTCVGIAAPYLATMGQDNEFRVQMIFASRAASILIAAFININMLRKAINARDPNAVSTAPASENDSVAISIPTTGSAEKTGCFGKFCAFFSKKQQPEATERDPLLSVRSLSTVGSIS